MPYYAPNHTVLSKQRQNSCVRWALLTYSIISPVQRWGRKPYTCCSMRRITRRSTMTCSNNIVNQCKSWRDPVGINLDGQVGNRGFGLVMVFCKCELWSLEALLTLPSRVSVLRTPGVLTALKINGFCNASFGKSLASLLIATFFVQRLKFICNLVTWSGKCFRCTCTFQRFFL